MLVIQTVASGNRYAVSMYFSVMDEGGNPVQGLTADCISVRLASSTDPPVIDVPTTVQVPVLDPTRGLPVYDSDGNIMAVNVDDPVMGEQLFDTIIRVKALGLPGFYSLQYQPVHPLVPGQFYAIEITAAATLPAGKTQGQTVSGIQIPV